MWWIWQKWQKKEVTSVESRILNFPDAMKFAKFLEDKEIGWMLFDDSLTFQDFIDLVLDILEHEDFMRLLGFLVVDVTEVTAKSAISGLVNGIINNRVRELLEVYRKNWVK